MRIASHIIIKIFWLFIMFNRMISERREMFSSREENRIMDIIEAGPMAKYGAYDLSSEINYVNPWDVTKKDEVKTI